MQPVPTVYQQRRALGLCGIPGCEEEPGDHAFCGRHRGAQSDAHARRRAAGLTFTLSLRPTHAADLGYVCEQFGLGRQDALRLMIAACAKEVRSGRLGISDLRAGGGESTGAL